MSILGFFRQLQAIRSDAQAKAQAKLEAVVGLDRLPEHSGRDAPPYVNAIAKEALRWQNVGSFGVVHRLTADDYYKGHSLPKGTLSGGMFGESITPCDTGARIAQRLPRGMVLNPKVYPNPGVSDPMRYTKGSVQNPANVSFRSERRQACTPSLTTL